MATERFNVVIVSPPGYGFSETFREVGETLLYGMRHLGHDVSLVVNEFRNDAVNIVLGAHLLDEEGSRCLPARSIIYNFEQVHGASQWIKPVYVDLVRRHLTWDYSRRNIACWLRYVEARLVHVPIGYVPELTRIASPADADIDVLFYGVINARRASIIEKLKEAGLSVVAVCGKFGAERDALIARAKVVLNVHFFETKILELPRISYLLANRKAVVTEIDADTEVDEDIRESVAGVSYDKLFDKCVELVFDDVPRRRLAESGFNRFVQRKEHDVLARALAATPAPADADPPSLPKVINVGSGKRWNIEWLNLDSDPLWMPDLLADLNTPLPTPDQVDLGRFGRRVVPQNYFDEVHASHVLEHVAGLTTAMESFLCLLREGGVLSVEVPYDLSYGAWQDPTHVRAMNERSWLYYTEWFWYLGWREFRFEVVELQYLLSDIGQQLVSSGTPTDQLTRLPRAIDAMKVKLRKIALTEAEKQRSSQRWLA